MTARNFCPHCRYPVLRKIEGANFRRCAHCGRHVRPTATKRTHESSRARFVRSALKTLELLSDSDLAHGRNAKNYLSIPELEALTLAMRFATKEARTRAKLPRMLNFEGVQLRLSYSNFGRVFIVSRRTGRVLVSSGFGAQW